MTTGLSRCRRVVRGGIIWGRYGAGCDDRTVGMGSCRAQGLTLPSGERTWTVLGAGHRVVGPAEEYLEYLRAQQVSPNTVKSYSIPACVLSAEPRRKV